MDLDISRLEEISTGDIGNFHAINSMDLWGGSSLSYACPWELVGTKPSQHGRALIPFLLGAFSCMTWTDGCVEQPLIGRQYAYFHKVAA